MKIISGNHDIDFDNGLWIDGIGDEGCCICDKRIYWMEPGTCYHENGLGHHLECNLTPEKEKEILDANSNND